MKEKNIVNNDFEKIKISRHDVIALKKISELHEADGVGFDYSYVVVKKPWGYEYLLYQNKNVAVWVLFIKKDHKTSMHCHPNKKTSLLVLSGSVVCFWLNSNIKRKVGQGLVIDKGVFHRTEAISDEGATVLEVETPANKTDLKRYIDEYGRKGKAYENLDNVIQHDSIDNFISEDSERIIGDYKAKLISFNSKSDFDKKFKNKKWDLICLLKGNMKCDSLLLEKTKFMNIAEFKKYKSIKIINKVELLVLYNGG